MHNGKPWEIILDGDCCEIVLSEKLQGGIFSYMYCEQGKKRSCDGIDPKVTPRADKLGEGYSAGPWPFLDSKGVVWEPMKKDYVCPSVRVRADGSGMYCERGKQKPIPSKKETKPAK